MMASRNAHAAMALAQEQQTLLATKARLVKDIHHIDVQLSERRASAARESQWESKSSSCPSSSSTTWIFSGIINGLLKVIFCNVYATLVYDAAPHLLKDSFVVLVGTQLSSSLLTNLITARSSQLGASISGPDIVHCIFLATMVETIATKTDDAAVATATLLFLVCFTSLCVSLTWLIVARFNLTIAIDFFPVAVTTGFLGCVGYKVLKSAIKVAVGRAWYFFPAPSGSRFVLLLLPALPLGLCLYLLKRYHIGSKMIVLPFFLIVPPLIFFLSAFALDLSFDRLRQDGWMFERFTSAMFWEQWSRLDFTRVHWEAVAASLPDTFVLIIIITLDSLMYLRTSTREMNVRIDMVHELYMHGYQNLLSVLSVGSVGYTLYESTVLINYSITHSSTERRPMVVVGALCGAVWLMGLPVINVMPRFYMSGLLIYAGLPFLWLVVTAYWRVTKKEFGTILLIMLINFIFELFPTTKTRALVIAVGCGFLLSSFTFILQYAKSSVIRDSLLGKDYQSSVSRSYQEQLLVERLGVRFAIVELEGYIFFGSCHQVVRWAREMLRESEAKPLPERVQYVVLDLKHVENIDFTGSAIFRRVLVPLLQVS